MYHTKIGHRIKTARENAHVTQEELASTIGCTTQHISAIERGQKTPKLDTFVRIANTLQISADVLLQDVLEHGADPLTCEFSLAMDLVPRELQSRLLQVIRVFSDEQEYI